MSGEWKPTPEQVERAKALFNRLQMHMTAMEQEAKTGDASITDMVGLSAAILVVALQTAGNQSPIDTFGPFLEALHDEHTANVLVVVKPVANA